MTTTTTKIKIAKLQQQQPAMAEFLTALNAVFAVNKRIKMTTMWLHVSQQQQQ